MWVGIAVAIWVSKTILNYIYRSPSERSIMAQIRLGILPLEVETGRFHNVKLDDRICKRCNKGVEDESHFMFECTLYDQLREELFNGKTIDFPDFIYLEYTEQLEILFEQCHRKVAKFLKRAYAARKSFLFAEN